MKQWSIGLAVAAVIAALIYWIVTGIADVAQRATAIHDDVITRYVRLLQQRDYAAAWDQCLAANLQSTFSQPAFVAAHTEHHRQYGPLQDWTQTDITHEANLFSDESVIGINAILHYKDRDVFVSYKVDSSIVPYRIQEIFGSPGSSTALESGIW